MRTLPVGGRLHRVHEAAWGSRQYYAGSAERPARFSPFTPDGTEAPLPVLYAALDLAGALSETVFHDVPVRGRKVVARSALVHKVAVTLLTRRPVRLVDLTSNGLSRLGVARTELVESSARAYPTTAAWARALHGCPERPDGLLWVSRQQDTSTAVVLFGDRVGTDDLELAPEAWPMPLLVHEGYDAVARIAADAGITITET